MPGRCAAVIRKLARTRGAGPCRYQDRPMNLSGPSVANADTLREMEYVIKTPNDYDLAHLLLIRATTDFAGSTLEHLAGDGMFQHFRRSIKDISSPMST
jgi:hypothetical protein